MLSTSSRLLRRSALTSSSSWSTVSSSVGAAPAAFVDSSFSLATRRFKSSDIGDVIGIDLGTTNSCVSIMVRVGAGVCVYLFVGALQSGVVYVSPNSHSSFISLTYELSEFDILFTLIGLLFHSYNAVCHEYCIGRCVILDLSIDRAHSLVSFCRFPLEQNSTMVIVLIAIVIITIIFDKIIHAILRFTGRPDRSCH